VFLNIINGHVEFLSLKDIMEWDWIKCTLGIGSYALSGTGFPKARPTMEKNYETWRGLAT
jgi:hypothetical protein